MNRVRFPQLMAMLLLLLVLAPGCAAPSQWDVPSALDSLSIADTYPPQGSGGGGGTAFGDTGQMDILQLGSTGTEIFEVSAGVVGIGASNDGTTADGTLALADITLGNDLTVGSGGVVKLNAGTSNATSLNWGTAGTGLYGTSNSILMSISTAKYVGVGFGFVDFYKDARCRDGVGMWFGTSPDRFIQGEASVLADDTASEFVAIQSALGDAGGCVITYTVKLTDATGVRATRTGTLTVSTLDGAAGVGSAVGDVGQTHEESGTTTWAFAVDGTDDGDLEITCQTTTTLTPTSIVISWTANVSGDVTLVATP